MSLNYPVLSPGQFLKPGDTLTSPSQAFHAAIGPDNDFCVFYGAPGGGGPVSWRAGKASSGAAYVWMQNDGNLCMYAGTATTTPAPNSALWCASTEGTANNLSLGDDGTMCVWKMGTSPMSPLWTTGAAKVFSSAYKGARSLELQVINNTNVIFVVAQTSVMEALWMADEKPTAGERLGIGGAITWGISTNDAGSTLNAHVYLNAIEVLEPNRIMPGVNFANALLVSLSLDQWGDVSCSAVGHLPAEYGIQLSAAVNGVASLSNYSYRVVLTQRFTTQDPVVTGM
jgi:hypothetical protein